MSRAANAQITNPLNLFFFLLLCRSTPTQTPLPMLERMMKNLAKLVAAPARAQSPKKRTKRKMLQLKHLPRKSQRRRRHLLPLPQANLSKSPSQPHRLPLFLQRRLRLPKRLRRRLPRLRRPKLRLRQAKRLRLRRGPERPRLDWRASCCFCQYRH